jgi:hypothetical protein
VQIHHPRARLAIHLLLAAIGIGGTIWLTSYIGFTRVADAVAGSGTWFALVLAIEGARIALDAAATQMLLDKRAPLGPLVYAHILAYPLVLLFPAGRLAGEALKANVLAPHVGLDRAAAAAIFNQALPLIGGFVISLPCVVVAAARLGVSHALTIAVLIQMLTAAALALAIMIAARRKSIGQMLNKLSPRLGVAAEKTRGRVFDLGWLPLGPLAAAVANRTLLGVQLVSLTVGLRAGEALDGVLVLGAHLVGAAAGDVIPAQIGATDGSLALAAESVAITLEQAVAISLLFHASQLVWAAVGGASALFRPQLPPHSTSHSSPVQSSRSKMSKPGRPH